VVFEVAAAYFGVLQARANRVVAAEAVERAEAHLRDARNFVKRGTAVRNDVLRAEVLVAEMKLGLVRARTAEAVAVAALNRTIGINVSRPTEVVDQPEEPPFALSLGRSLQLAVDSREEFQVVLRAIAAARFGADHARADFWPHVYVAGMAVHEEGPTVTANDLANVGLNIQFNFFEGGRRLARLEAARSEIREAVARAKDICDRIAFEVNAAWLEIADARERIGLARTAVTHGRENLRVVSGLFRQGDATPTDVVDAELALVRAQQSYYTALYEYQTALARLEYAVGAPLPVDGWQLPTEAAAEG
jgi:outer membrane protein TolC